MEEQTASDDEPLSVPLPRSLTSPTSRWTTAGRSPSSEKSLTYASRSASAFERER
jgi:hypothetical protein